MEQEALVPILKPCPFCGDRPQILQTGTFVVQCADCGAMGPPAPNMERAAVRWNKRKGDNFGWYSTLQLCQLHARTDKRLS